MMEHGPRLIVVGSSLEPASDAAVRLAIELKERTAAKLFLFHAHSLPVAYFAGPTGMTTISPNLLETERQLRERMVDVQLERIGASRDPLDGVIIQAGAPHRLLLETVTELAADLIVLGTNEHPERMLHGSTTDKVLRKTTCPVWVVMGTPQNSAQHVLAPVDLSPLSEECLVHGLELLQQLSKSGRNDEKTSTVEALFVLTPEERNSSAQFSGEQIERLAREELDRFVERLRGGVAQSLAPKVRVGDIRQEILRDIEEKPPRLMILGTHGRNGFERFLLGSVAVDMAGHSPCDVLLIPPHEAAS